jgi:alpha-D-ribose 1-methylphosphonate 5-triphosphate synthase subunit PhnG
LPAEQSDPHASPGRKETLSVLARATLDELRRAWTTLDPRPDYTFIRAPEAGLVMIRGRMGGGGPPFNLGEATVTKAIVSLGDGVVGIATVLGRDRLKAGLAALLDAAWQTDAHRGHVDATLLQPVRSRLQAEAEATARRAAATRVEFFTLVRGEDQ